MKTKSYYATLMAAVMVLSTLLLGGNAIAGVITGMVQNINGEPIGNAQVSAYSYEGGRLLESTRANDGGEYELVLEVRCQYCKVKADAEDYAEQWFDHQLNYEEADIVEVPEDGIVENIDFSLSEGMPEETGGMTGTVFGFNPPEPEEFPLPGAVVAVFLPEHEHPFRVTEAREGGFYNFEELPVGDYFVMSHTEGFYPQWYPESPNPEGAELVEITHNTVTEGINFLLEGGGNPEFAMISGFVHAHGDENPPLPGSEVFLFDEHGQEPIRQTETNENGMYIFGELPPGVYFVHAVHDGFRPQWFDMKEDRREADPVPINPGDEVENISFLLHRGGGEEGSVSGRVREMRPHRVIEGAHVLAFHPESDEPVAETRSANNGFYTFEYLPPGNYQFLTVAEEYFPQWFDHVMERERAVVIEVHPDSHIEDIDFDLVRDDNNRTGFIGIVVTDEEEPHPIPHAMVRAFEMNHNRPVGRAVTNGHGEYMISLPPGEYIAVAKARHFLPEWFDNKEIREEADIIIVEEGEITEHIDFSLSLFEMPTGAIFGVTVNGESGEPLPEVRITARMIEPEQYMRSAHSNREGNYEIRGLHPGRYVVFAEKPGFYPVEYSDTILVEEEAVGPVDLGLYPIITGYLSGHVYNAEDNEPIWNGRVMAVNTNNPDIHRITNTHRDGFYIFDELPEGYYMVRAEAYGFQTANYPDSVGVFEEQPAEGIDFYLEPIEFGSISGLVTSSNYNEPIAQAVIHARLLHSQWEGHTRSLEDGTYELGELLTGYYILSAVAEGYYPQDYPDSVFVDNNGHVEDINFELIPRETGECHISGTVYDYDSGDPLRWAWVIAFGPRGDDGRPVVYEFTYVNDEGFYAFDNLPSEYEYRVHASAPCHIGVFFDGVSYWEEATPVSCGTDNIDFHLLHNSGGGFLGITGVISLGQHPIPGSIVSAEDGEGNIYCTSSDISGYYRFNDIPPGQYQITATDFAVGGQYPGVVEIVFNDFYDADITLQPTDTDDDIIELPLSTELLGNYPNPFNPETAIMFRLASASQVKISIYNITGQKIIDLTDTEYNAGSHNIIWDSKDSNGLTVSAGMYFYRFEANNESRIGKMTLIK
ncbi:MAG: T9SS type A sorting domain-containing protein [candidate division Zixibacteria bacterium]|nr:T9SS type A sorting domain-containing protein [candidate division Zixibacteria bacterium]